MSPIYGISIALNIYAAVILAILLIATLAGGEVKTTIVKWFLIIQLCIQGELLGEIIFAILQGRPGVEIALILRLTDAGIFIFYNLCMFAFAKYFQLILATVDREQAGVRMLRVNGVLCGLNLILVLVSFLGQLMYSLGNDNIYTPGSHYWLTNFFAGLPLLFCGLTAILNRRYLGSKLTLTVLLYTLTPIIGLTFEGVVAELWLSIPANALMVLILYVNIQGDVLAKQRRALAEGRQTLMLSQIQPHFLYNALSAIEKLCAVDSRKAKGAVNDFAHYLRMNLDSLSATELISFEDELDHVETYLGLEKLRLEERLNIVYEIGPMDFCIPPLSLQPLVENAVRHGISRSPQGGTLTIMTWASDHAYFIEIRDDGVGALPEEIESASQDRVGIKNVRERLAQQMGGSLVITSAPGCGTEALITIPKKGSRS